MNYNNLNYEQLLIIIDLIIGTLLIVFYYLKIKYLVLTKFRDLNNNIIGF